MAGPKTKPKSRENRRRPPAAADAFAAAVGGLVRSARAKRGITRRQLAEQSGASERYLAQIESGQGNPSVTILKGIADALDVPVVELLPRCRRPRRSLRPHPRPARGRAAVRACRRSPI